MILGTQGGVQIENNEKLEFDDPLNENAMFLRSQGLQNEAKMVPKRAERRNRVVAACQGISGEYSKSSNYRKGASS